MTLEEYIDLYFWDNQSDFARAQGVSPTQVTRWLNDDKYVIHNHELLLKRRTLSPVRVRKEKEKKK